jgi:calcium-dependent protein kinase
MAYDI